MHLHSGVDMIAPSLWGRYGTTTLEEVMSLPESLLLPKVAPSLRGRYGITASEEVMSLLESLLLLKVAPSLWGRYGITAPEEAGSANPPHALPVSSHLVAYTCERKGGYSRPSAAESISKGHSRTSQFQKRSEEPLSPILKGPDTSGGERTTPEKEASPRTRTLWKLSCLPRGKHTVADNVVRLGLRGQSFLHAPSTGCGPDVLLFARSLPPEGTSYSYLLRRLAAPYLLRGIATPYLLRRLVAPYLLRGLATSLPPEETGCSLPSLRGLATPYLIRNCAAFTSWRTTTPYLLRGLATHYLLRRLAAPYLLRGLATPYLLRRLTAPYYPDEHYLHLYPPEETQRSCSLLPEMDYYSLVISSGP
ncbi:hypothetical protein Tco_0868028 [Tanacetum coccineum]